MAGEEQLGSGTVYQPDSPRDVADMDELIAALRGRARPSLQVRALKKYLRTHKRDAAELERKEGRLRTIILQAAGYGFQETLEKALQVLRRMHETHLLQTERLLDFHDDRFYSPLMYACEAGHVEVAEYLLNSGATANYVGRQLTFTKKGKGSGLSAMHLACIRGSTEVVRLLITRASGYITLNARTVKDKWTPLMYAVREYHIDVVRMMLETESVDVLAVNGKGQTVLHIAASGSQLQCLKEIHTKLPPADIAQVQSNPYLKEDKKGRNVLHHVCCGPEGSVETLQWLLEVMPHLQTPEILNMGKKSKGYTMLLLACDNNNVEMVRYLLSLQEVEVSACTADGKTGLHLAAIHDYPEVAQELIKHRITLTAQDETNGDTALHIALRKSSLDVAEVIRSSEGAEELKSITNKAKRTPDTITPEQIIPKEIEKLGEAAVKKYMQALRKGRRKKMPRCNLIVLGEKRVGKTSLLRLVMGKEFIADLESTRGIDNEHVDVVDTKAICSLQWQEVRPEDQAKSREKQFISSVAEELKGSITGDRGKRRDKERNPPNAQVLSAEIDGILHFLDTIQQASQEPPLLPAPASRSAKETRPSVMRRPEVAPHVQPSKTKPVPPPSSLKLKQTEMSHVDLRPRDPPKPPPAAAVQRPVVPTQPPQVAQPPPPPPPSSQTRRRGEPLRFSRRVSKSVVSTAKQGAKEEEPVLHLNTLDFAGQKVYRPMHHCFIVRRALYLVVFNLQKIREALKCPNPDQEASLEEIGYWLHSIHVHVHRICQEPTLKRIILVGTHKAPQEQKKINDEEMVNIHKALKAKFVHGDIANDLRYVYPNHSDNGVVFAAVENSADGEDEKARQESGALLVQSEIQKAWQDLPFKDEEYPTTWLRFETSLNQMRGSHFAKLEDIKQLARQCHIGEEDEEEIELALGFFHDTGTLVYMKKLPSIYLDPSEKEKLNDFVLLDPTWLMKVMRIVMELKMGIGQIRTTDVINLKETGTMKSSILKECWANLCNNEVSFHNLCLILQSFCLIFPVSSYDSLPAQRSASSPATTQLTAQEQDHTSEVFARSQSEGDPASKEDTTYLIPSMLPRGDGPTEGDLAKYKITFCFDFQGFLPVEVYHRLLCLMLRDQKIRPTLTTTGTFTEEYFQVKGVHDNNWMVQKVDDKLKIFVADSSTLPKMYISLIHTEYLRKICDEKESSLQGLKYIGGPDFTCPQCNRSGVLPCVSYSESDESEATSDEVPCEECLRRYNINHILDPKEKHPETFSQQSEGGASTDKVYIIHQAKHVVVAESGSSVSVHPTSSGTDQLKVLLPDHEPNAIEDGHLPSVHQPLAEIPAIQQAAEPSPPSLGIDDLQTVLEELVRIEKKWFHLGLALGLRQPTLKKIKDENDDTDDCKLEMLTKWLDKVEKSNPSWRSLVDALRNPTVKHKEVADVIEEKYL